MTGWFSLLMVFWFWADLSWGFFKLISFHLNFFLIFLWRFYFGQINFSLVDWLVLFAYGLLILSWFILRFFQTHFLSSKFLFNILWRFYFGQINFSLVDWLVLFAYGLLILSWFILRFFQTHFLSSKFLFNISLKVLLWSN